MKHSFMLVGAVAIAIMGCESTKIEGGGSAGSGGVAGNGSGTAGSMNTSSSGGGSTSGSGGGGGMSGSSSSGSGGGCGFCDFTCCDGVCVNTGNDINNCGACGNKCGDTNTFCDNGVCGQPPCNGPLCGPAGTCCGSNCCAIGELCCSVPGPIVTTLGCFKPTAAGTCPTGCTSCECASPDTPVATPQGEKPMESLREGDLVYSVHQGAIVAVPIRRTQKNPVANHVVVHVELATGRSLEISPGHPTADGQSFAELSAGRPLGGMNVVSVKQMAYAHEFTYDILPDSDTGTYFAAGALIGSTMAKPLPRTSTEPNEF